MNKCITISAPEEIRRNQGNNPAELELDSNRGLSGQDIVTLSTQDWRDLWTRKQRFMLQFARQGNKVLYVESQYHWLTYLKRFRQQWRRVFLFLSGSRLAEKNLYIYTPPLLIPAFQIFPVLNIVNNFVLALFIKFEMRRLGIKHPFLWLYSHYNGSMVKKLGAKKALYECVDEFSGAKGLIKADVAREQERKTLRIVNAAIVTAPGLKASKAMHNRNIHVIPNAANFKHFKKARNGILDEPVEINRIRRPRLIFIGAVAYWIDLNLLWYVADQRRNWQLLLVGPVLVNTKLFEKLDNVHILGQKPYDALPGFLAHSNVALNPYELDSVAENCSPLKLYEYMAAGLPIVSTNMPEARHFPGIINVAASYDDFIRQIEKILSWNKVELAEQSARAINEAAKHTWENRFIEAEKVAMEVLG